MRMRKARLDLLIAHIDGPVPVNLKNAGTELMVLKEALKARVLVSVAPGPYKKWPKATRLSELGRHELALELAAMADALTKAHYLVELKVFKSDLADEPRKVAEPENLDKVA